MQLLALFTHHIILAKYSIEDDFSWTPRRRRLVVLNTTPLSALREQRDRESPVPDVENGLFCFVHIGVIRRERGSEQLLEGIRELAAWRRGDFRVKIIGEFKDGSQDDFFRKAERYGIRELIEFHPWIPFPEAFALVCRSHAGLFSSAATT